MASLSDLRTATRRLLDETDSSNTNFSDSELNDYLNNALRKVAVQMEWPIAVATATSVTGQAQYSLPDNFMFLLKVFFDGKAIECTDLEDMATKYPTYRDTDDDAPILAYRADNNQLGLYKPPSATYAGKSILIEYVKYATAVSSDSDVPDMAAVIQDLLPIWAAVLAMLRAGNYKAADYLRGLYKDEFKTLKPAAQKFAEEMQGFRWDDNNDVGFC